jgi:hypothetical protein
VVKYLNIDFKDEFIPPIAFGNVHAFPWNYVFLILTVAFGNVHDRDKSIFKSFRST